MLPNGKNGLLDPSCRIPHSHVEPIQAAVAFKLVPAATCIGIYGEQLLARVKEPALANKQFPIALHCQT